MRKEGNRLATLIGFLLGGFVPLACYWLAHYEHAAWSEQGGRALGLVTGGLMYSAVTVFQWAKQAFVSAFKSVGFCVLVEGVMITSTTLWLSVAALCYLVVINGVATGVTLSIGKKA
jgi:hypothetical protein